MINEQDSVGCYKPPPPAEPGTILALVNNSMWTGLRAGTDTPIDGSRPDRYRQGLWLTERPRVGATEIWEMLDIAGFAHPMHIHLVQFQVLNRQDVDIASYTAAWAAEFPGGTFDGQNCDGTLGKVNYPPGTVIPGYGPPRDYLTPSGRRHRRQPRDRPPPDGTGHPAEPERGGLEGHRQHPARTGHSSDRPLGTHGAARGHRQAGRETASRSTRPRDRATSGTATSSTTRTTR